MIMRRLPFYAQAIIAIREGEDARELLQDTDNEFIHELWQQLYRDEPHKRLNHFPKRDKMISDIEFKIRALNAQKELECSDNTRADYRKKPVPLPIYRACFNCEEPKEISPQAIQQILDLPYALHHAAQSGDSEELQKYKGIYTLGQVIAGLMDNMPQKIQDQIHAQLAPLAAWLEHESLTHKNYYIVHNREQPEFTLMNIDAKKRVYGHLYTIVNKIMSLPEASRLCCTQAVPDNYIDIDKLADADLSSVPLTQNVRRAIAHHRQAQVVGALLENSAGNKSALVKGLQASHGRDKLDDEDSYIITEKKIKIDPVKGAHLEDHYLLSHAAIIDLINIGVRLNRPGTVFIDDIVRNAEIERQNKIAEPGH